MHELSVKCLLCNEDQVILAPSACELRDMVTEINDSLKKKLPTTTAQGFGGHFVFTRGDATLSYMRSEKKIWATFGPED
ncbi:hypothetical protein EVAR_35960_1 [Eumeta japonica]|uniref:Uncharacterized protein n=1 Tax=Eumeta variegata TaxID=151549 RepID=A0A4C1W3R2_EUMVA|nr:hypothetical protein EVAR_35960_1 [Eumeta japonica]